MPEQWRLLYSINPMVGVVEGFRWALLGGSSPPPVILLSSMSMVALLLVGDSRFLEHRLVSNGPLTSAHSQIRSTSSSATPYRASSAFW